MEKIGIVLLTGFLGAGKTTVLNHLLGLPAFQARRPALIINEFGELGVDGALVRPGPWRRFELNKGSLFCICLKTDFLRTLEEIAAGPPPGVLLIEATGVAETRDIAGFVLAPHLAGRFEIRANLCVADAPRFLAVLPMLRAVGAQAEWADGIVLNKADLAPAEELAAVRKVLRRLNPSAPQIETCFGAVPLDFLDGLSHRPREAALAAAPPDAVFSLTFQTPLPVDRAAFLEVLEHRAGQVLRLKGRVDFGAGPVHFEIAGGRCLERPLPGPARTGTAFVVIGWEADEDEMREALESTWRRAPG